jgi:hypothetical protein
MSNGNSEEYVEKIEDYIEKIGSQHFHTGEDNSGNKIIYGKYSEELAYQVVQETEDRFRVIYKYDLLKSMGKSLHEENVRMLLDEQDLGDLNTTVAETGEEVSISPDPTEGSEIVLEDDIEQLPPRYRAARELLNSVDSESMDRFKFELFQGISSTNVSPELKTTDEGAVRNFSVSRLIFPGDSGFSLTEFNRSVMSVVNQGIFGENMANKMMPDIEVPHEKDVSG